MNKVNAALLAVCVFAAAGAHAADDVKNGVMDDAARTKKLAAEEKEDTKKLAAMGKDEMGNDASRKGASTKGAATHKDGKPTKTSGTKTGAVKHEGSTREATKP